VKELVSIRPEGRRDNLFTSSLKLKAPLGLSLEVDRFRA
jgi:hypothetical protein